MDSIEDALRNEVMICPKCGHINTAKHGFAEITGGGVAEYICKRCKILYVVKYKFDSVVVRELPEEVCATGRRHP
jgi:transposase-like protein